MKTTRRAGLGALAGLLLCACTTFDFTDQQILLRHDADEDVLEMVIAYEGLKASDRKGTDVVDAIRGGRPHFILMGWPWEFDLPAILEEEKESEDELVQRALAFMAEIRVAEVQLFSDNGRLCLLQRIIVPDVSKGLAILNDAANRAILEAERKEGGLGGSNFEDMDERTVELWVRHAREGRSWALFDGGALVVTVPLSAEGAARVLAEVAQAEDDEGLSQVFDSLTELFVTGDEVRLRFTAGDDGWLRFSFDFTDREYDSKLAEALAERGIEVEHADLAKELERMLAEER